MTKNKCNMLTYKKKKETIKKKTKELSILCDIKACVILVDPNGEVDTWPENSNDFNPIIQSYKTSVEGVIDDGCLKKKSKKNHALFCESNESLLVKLNSKLEAVEKRIEFLKTVNCGNSSGKDTVLLADQETHKSVAINVDQEVVAANQENYSLDFDEFWGSHIDGDQFNGYNEETEIGMAAEFWGINGCDQLRDCSVYDQSQVGFWGLMPKMNMWETLNNVQNFDDLCPIITGSEFDVLQEEEATGFGTLANTY